MKKKKTYKIVTLSIIFVLLLTAILVFVLNYSKENSNYSLIEKKWINDNSNKVVDIQVFNDIPLYGNGGNGVIFDFLNNFTKEYEIQFNMLSYYKNDEVTYKDLAFKILKENEEINDNQILFYEDSYVLLGNKDKQINDYNDIDGDIGILKSDLSDVTYNLDISEDKLILYDDIDSLIRGYNDELVSYLILPNVMYMDKIISNKLEILYHISDISKKYVLEVSDNNLYQILNKYYLEFMENGYIESYSKNYLDIYFNNSDYTDADRVNYNSTVYTYGYVANMPFENNDGSNFVGIISNYLNEFCNITNIDIKLIKYDNIEDLKSALIIGDVDFALGNFDVTTLGSEFNYTNRVIDLDYVVLAKNYYSINNITGLNDKEISLVSSSRLDNLFKSKKVSISGYDNTDELMRSLDDDSIVAMDKNMYLYYRDGKLKDYKVILEDNDLGYQFVIGNKNNVFASLFSYYTTFKNYNDIKYEYNTKMDTTDSKDLELLFIILLSILLVIILTIIGIASKKRKKIKELINIDDKQKFIDVMTSLKNRNYLNYSIPKWDENIIYPQAIIIINLNNLKVINDTYGHEKGDEVIKLAANILISNQLEKTDLVRTDGNEFLIYMVGYNEKDVYTYAKKIYKEFKELPYGYGCCLGYSMIEDDVKTIDDAINEAVIDMNNNREALKK